MPSELMSTTPQAISPTAPNTVTGGIHDRYRHGVSPGNRSVSQLPPRAHDTNRMERHRAVPGLGGHVRHPGTENTIRQTQSRYRGDGAGFRRDRQEDQETDRAHPE